MTYQEWLSYIKSLRYDQAPLWFLFCEVTNKKRSDILLSGQEIIPDEQLALLQEGTNRLIQTNYPPQYFIGYTYFYKRKFYVNPSVLIPRYDTEILIEKTLTYLNDYKTVLDVGTGSGAIAVTLKKERPLIKVSALDISDLALEVAIKNAFYHEAEIDFIQSNLFENITFSSDVIVANPPYIDPAEKIMEMVNLYEPHLALYSAEGGLATCLQIIKQAPQYLNKDGLLIMEINSLHAQVLKNKTAEYFTDIEFIKDYNNRNRVMIARRK